MFNDILRLLRQEKEVSQQEVADYLQITRQAYNNYENGKREPDYEILLKLSEYFNVSVDYLVRGETSAERGKEIDNIYFDFAKKAQEDGIDPHDIELAIEMIKKLRSQK